MGSYVVLGAGGIGRATAKALTDAGHEVTLASRRGTDPGVNGVRAVAADARDAAGLSQLAVGASGIVNAINPPSYHHWERDWPPIATAVLAAAEATGAGLVTVSNLYLYGRVDAPMTETTPIRPAGSKGRVRAQMWADALAAHQAGRARVTELRASDYFGPTAGRGTSFFNTYVATPAAKGSTVRLIMGIADAPHSWTYLDDIGALAATLAADYRAWGRAWHVPSAPAKTIGQVAGEVAALAGRPAPRVIPLPRLVKLAARVAPVVRELDETSHQFERPFVLDATSVETTFGLTATPWTAALEATVTGLQTAAAR